MNSSDPTPPPPLPQPPPPSPPQAPPATPPKPGMSPLTIVMICVAGMFLVIIVIAALAGLAAPLVLRQKKKAEQAASLSNSRALGFALLEFETEYGRLPDAQTAADVAERTGSTIAPPGTSANALLRQLIAAGILNNETVCYTKTAFTHKPDNIFDTPETALAPGELGYGYLLNGDTGLTLSGSPNMILLCAPLAMEGNAVSPTKFDPGPYGGQAATLRLDLSARSHPIDSASGEITIDGNNWLTTGEGTIWGTEITPRVATPEPK